jgi:hypothetical protein
MVNKQLRVMPHIDLVPNVSSLRMGNDGGMLVGISEGVARAKVKPNEANSEVSRIILMEGAVPQVVYFYYGLRSQASQDSRFGLEPQFEPP